MKYTILPSIIASSQAELEKRLALIRPLKPELIQLDVMDGIFVKHTSLEFDFKLPQGVKAEAHLMVEHPSGWFGHHHTHLKSVLVHYTPTTRLHAFIEEARLVKKKVGIALNPDIPAESISQYIRLVDKILVMTVQPGSYGSRFLPVILAKIRRIRELAPKLDIQVDGGITPETLKRCKDAGANQFVVGSYLQNARNVNKAWKELHQAL